MPLTRRWIALLGMAAFVLPITSGCVALAGPVIGGAIAAGATARENASAKDAAVAAAMPGRPITADTTSDASATPDAAEPAPRVAAVPLPTPVADAPAPDAAVAATPIGRFGAFVQAQMTRNPVLLPRLSAILRDPSSLDGFRAFCGAKPVAVAVDLDPAAGTLDFDDLPNWTAELAPILALARNDDLAVAWISNRPARDADTMRAGLRQAGLNPAGEDILLLDDGTRRKQERRQALQESHCLVAILGDELADFDELFDYLIEPEAAWQLEEMMEQGWFLASGSSPSAPARPQPESE